VRSLVARCLLLCHLGGAAAASNSLLGIFTIVLWAAVVDAQSCARIHARASSATLNATPHPDHRRKPKPGPCGPDRASRPHHRHAGRWQSDLSHRPARLSDAERIGNWAKHETSRCQFRQIGEHRGDQIAEIQFAGFDEFTSGILG
jgi:hypothetical protein